MTLLCGTSAPVAPDSALARGTGVAIGDVVLKRFVYVLRNAETPARYYTGLSSDVVKRLASHNAGDNRHTAKYRPWSIYVVIEFPDDRRAVAFERYLKSGSGVAFAQRPPGTRIAGCEG